MTGTEIEIQVKIENTRPLLDFLKKKAEFKSHKHQIDEYFTPAHRNFLAIRPVKEWLRLRNSGGKCSLNYKNWHFDKSGRSYHCDEYESEVQNLAQIRKILNALNFKSIVKVDKVRKTWVYKNYEIFLDSVKSLGDFVEIEYIGKGKVDPKQTTSEMIEFLKNLGCGKIKRNYAGYPFMLLFPKETKTEIQ